MTGKTYIVASKQQELNVLKKFEEKGLKWASGRKPTEFFPGNTHPFPILLRERDRITWDYLDNLKNEEIVYDGRKGEKVYKVTGNFINELKQWRDINNLDALQGNWQNKFRALDFKYLPDMVDRWRIEDENPIERNNRLIAIIQWLNGENVFEVEAPHKFIVRSDKKDHDGYYAYVAVENDMTTAAYTFVNATKFDTLEEAQQWANSHQVVIEIDEELNEVE